MPKKNQDPVAAAELEKLLAVTDIAAKDRIALRDTVFAYFTAAQKSGAPMDTIRNSVMELLRVAESRVAGTDEQDGYHELAEDLIDWCVRREAGRREAKGGPRAED